MTGLWRHRKLTISMVRRDILARYRGSFGGALWMFLSPLLLMATYFFVFGIVLNARFSGDASRSGYVLYFLAGMLPWLAFSEAVGRALLIPQVLFTAGLCWTLAATGAFIRDLGQVIGFILTLWFVLTPICYEESSALPEWVGHVLAFNPIYVLVKGYRAILLENHSPWNARLFALWMGSAAVATLGYAWFHRLRNSFADVI